MSYQERRAGQPTGRWIGERVVKGRRERFRASSKAAADRWEAYIDATGKLPLDGTGSPARHSIGAVAQAARRERPGWKASSDPSLDQRLDEVVAFFGHDSALETITTDKIYEFVGYLETRKGRKGKISPKTINRYLATLSGLLDYARDLSLTSIAVKIPWQVEEEGRILFLTEEEEAKVSTALPDDLHRLCLFVLARTGLRASEFFDLQASQVDAHGNVSAWIRLWGEDTKSRKGRSIPLRDFGAARRLKAAIESRELPKHHEFYAAFKRAVGRCALNEELNVHSLRHTTATRLARKVKPAVVQDFMGHSSYRTTQKYIHLVDEDRIAAAEALG